MVFVGGVAMGQLPLLSRIPRFILARYARYICHSKFLLDLLFRRLNYFLI